MNTTERWMKKHAAPLTGKRIALTGATGGLGSEWFCRIGETARRLYEEQ